MTGDLHAELAVRLRDAQRRVGSLAATDDQRARVARRLIALTDASKRDAVRASARLDALLADLDAGRLPPPDDGPDDGPDDATRTTAGSGRRSQGGGQASGGGAAAGGEPSASSRTAAANAADRRS